MQGPEAGSGPRGAAGEGRRERALVAAAVLFGLAAPFSIFAAQTAIALLAILSLLRPRATVDALRAHPGIIAAVAFYFLVQGLSVVFSLHPERSLRLMKGDLPVLLLPLWLALLHRPAVRRAALPALLAALGLAGLLGFFQYAAGVDPLGRALERYPSGGFLAVGTFGGHLTYAGVIMLGFAAALALWTSSRGRRRIGPLLLLACTGAGLLGSHARSAWLGAAGGAAAAAIFSAWGARRAPRAERMRALVPALGLAMAALLVLLLAPGIAGRAASLALVGDDPRVRLWGTALRIFSDHPLFGAGLGSFPTLFPLYRLPGHYMATCHPHNDLLNTLAHSGMAGVLALGALWWSILRSGLSRERTPDRRRLVITIAATFLVAGLGQCYFTDEEPAMVVWFLLAAALSGGASPALPPGGRGSAARGLERRAKERLLPLTVRLLPTRRSPVRTLAEAQRILLVRQDNRLGNLILLTPFLQALRESAPRARIGIVTGDRFGEMLAGCPWVDDLIVERKRWLIRHPAAYPWHLARIRRGGWQFAFELSNADTHSFYNAFLTQVSGAPARVGFDHPRSRPVLDPAVAAPAVECHYALAPLLLLAALGAEPALHPLRLPPALLASPAGAGEPPGAIVLHPGGRGAKRWPAERFAALVRRLRERGRAVRLIAGPADREALAALRSLLDPVPPARTPATVAEFVALLRGAALYVGCDAGPLHAAAAAGVPTLALFLSSHPLRYAPLGSSHEALLLGEESRRRAAAALPLRPPPPGPRAIAAPAAFVARIAELRPRMACPPPGAGPEEEIDFLLDRIEATLAAGKGGNG